MGRNRILSRGARATIAVVALYGLVLQAFLTGLAFPDIARAHGLSELCSPARDDGGAPVQHGQHGCCTLACAPLVPPPPRDDASAFVWPPRIAVVLTTYASAILPPARAPPTDAHSPRGPPAA